METFKPEILAPVGNTDMLYAAVRSGADAVYFGADTFNARRNAENFDKSAIVKAVEYCKICGVKSYLTLNILVSDKEMKNALELAVFAYKTGFDGVIVADIGLADLIHRRIPDFPLHASTQMTVQSPSAIKFLHKMGFKRAVLARELSKEQIAECTKTAKDLDMETEIFVHGALCMSVSGQCLLSAMLGGRSGNRGLCAGPCRLPFKVKGGTGFDLSLKDLSLLYHIKEISDIGVASLKIEGRMKRPEYVAAAVCAFRQATDNGKCDEKIINNLKSIFSRSGFTDGYFCGKKGKDMFGTRTKDDVTAATSAFSDIHSLYRNEYRRVPVSAEVTAFYNENITLTLCDGEHKVAVTGEKTERAQNRPSDRESILTSLDKFGGTPYYLKNFDCIIDKGIIVKNSLLNNLRREAIAQLDNARKTVPEIKENKEVLPIGAKRHNAAPRLVCRFESVGQIPENIQNIAAVIIPLECDVSALDLPENIIKCIDIPRGIVDENIIFMKLINFKNNGFTHAFCGNIAAIELSKKAGIIPVADFGMNIFNSDTAKYLEKTGIAAQVVSPELTVGDAAVINTDVPKGLIAYGRLPLMLTANCPVKNGTQCGKCDRKGVITDRTNTSFPVSCRMGFSVLYNSKVIWLADRMNDLNGFDFAVLYFTDEDKNRADEVIKAYKYKLTPDTDYTRGLYYRGVL